MAERNHEHANDNENERATAAAELGTFVAELSAADVPDEALRLAERAILDTVGVTLAGADTEAATAALAAVGDSSGNATVIGREETLGLTDAVFVNATAGHALDFDDVALAAMDGHPSVPMVAPLLAVGEREGASGRDVLTAYAAGFEAQCYVSRPISPGHYEGGWHATSTIGVFGAAAAVASLLDLTAAETTHALSVAASMPAGLKRNFGSTTKPIHAGQAARSGLTAALLAAEGATADPTAIGGNRGFADLYRGDDDPDFDRFPELGERWALLTDGIDVKKYPCCYYTHAAIYAASELAREQQLQPEAIDAVDVTASQGAADALHHDDPQTGLEAKFSMPYLLASALVRRSVGLAAFEAKTIAQPAVQQVRKRVSLTVDSDLPYDSNEAHVTVRTRSGETYERRQERPPGTHEEPLSTTALHEKFNMCAAHSPEAVDTGTARDALNNVRIAGNVADVLELL
ncbi:PrpD family protein [Natrialba magadii ATCC 43099]|uniref:PrpD family protein n=1 Tax=Natrialba magadii (strain ATCC 43099 / DSM 3394 / CCM 3739 / CIP 104546 / IAM 13178 / JCM 8861 / NBRC 102185 / NCIMB 2190 / MS3) TaxID=547559 RepID=D3STE0_NATMM|nr:MmgE/PrpD family protein [Natrialba magadii]ADD07007.1 PrpD family protein [Natrialba magadii ATCC 43099]ELY28850.1 MmgE/PrpD family protein [Natrialba magadii ATCC 43099]